MAPLAIWIDDYVVSEGEKSDLGHRPVLEESQVDHRFGRVANANLAGYLIPVAVDISSIDVIFVDEKEEHVGTIGAKGVGELGQPGMAPAIANAVWHATGRRFRTLPIRLDQIVV
jgi:xanthine dehydrogenase YagR molybdenum-binding subunit